MATGLNGTTQYLGTASAIVSEPFTVSIVFKADDALGQEALFSISNSGTNGKQHALYIGDAAAGSDNTIGVLTRSDSTWNAAATSTGITAGKWHQAGGIWRGIADRSAYLDGGGRGNNTVSKTGFIQNVTEIGRLGDSSPNWQFGGDMAEVAVWNVALTDAEMAWLGKLFSPLTLTHRLGNLVSYRDLIRDLNRPGIGPTFTAFNSPTVVSHPPINYPSAPIIGIPVAAAGGTTFFQTIAATAIGAATVAEVPVFAQSITATATGVASITKKMFVTISATAAGAATLVKKMFRTISAVATGVATVDEGLLSEQSISATATGVPNIDTTFIAGSAFIYLTNIMRAIMRPIMRKIFKEADD